MVDIQSPTAEIRRGKKERRKKKKIEITGQKYNVGTYYMAAITRSTGTVHTSTKARLVSDRYQNLIVCSTAHCQSSVKISCKSVWTFLHEVANSQTNKQRRLHIRLGGGNNQ